MSKTKIAINGFGRIGRLTFRVLYNQPDVEVVAINDLTENKMLAYLLQYDTAQGAFRGEVKADEDNLYVDTKTISALSQPDPEKLPWKEMGVDIVLECTGRFRDVAGMSKHITAGAKKVLLSAPGKGDIKTIVLGVNDHELRASDKLVSNASCTTNCLAPMVKVLNDNFGLEKGFMTTIHAYTADQNLQDAPHPSDYRRARAAAENIVPTSTGAAKAIGLVMPEMKGKLDGTAIRVPVVDGSVTELNAILKNEASVEAINHAMKTAAGNQFKGIMYYNEDPIVSSDILGNAHSCLFDAEFTKSMGNLVRVLGWYDNEAGYSNRLAELLIKMVKLA